MEDDHVLFVCLSTVVVRGKEIINMQLTSRKVLTINDVYHVLKVRKNIVSGSLLNKYIELKLIFVSDNFVMIKLGNFVGKGYLSEGMFKLDTNNYVNA